MADFMKKCKLGGPMDKAAGFVVFCLGTRPYRLAVRTLGSHPSNPGSIPGRVTKMFIFDVKQLVYLW